MTYPVSELVTDKPSGNPAAATGPPQNLPSIAAKNPLYASIPISNEPQ
jgi:hypothetical protein